MHDQQHSVLTDDKKKELLHTFRQSLEDVPNSHRFTDTVRDHSPPPPPFCLLFTLFKLLLQFLVGRSWDVASTKQWTIR